MNREIKFRAWDKFNGQYWHSENYKNLGDFFTKMQHLIDGGNNLIFEQYTGLEDKNGKEIYEGDVVIYNRGVGNWTGKRMETTHEIVFNEEVFAFVMKYGNSYIKLRKHWNYIYEVIGNIYENPELIK